MEFTNSTKRKNIEESHAHGYGNPAQPSFWEAAVLCFQAISKANLNGEARSHLLGKLFEEIDGLTRENKQKVEEEHVKKNVAPLQKTRDVQLTEKEELGFQTHGKIEENYQVDSFVPGRIDDSHAIIEFLQKAILNEDIVLKDKDFTLRCLHGSSLNEMNDKEAGRDALPNPKADGKATEAMESVEFFEQTGLCKNSFYPKDSTRFAVNKDSTAHIFEKGESCLQKLIAKSMEGTFHVDQDKLAGYISEFPKNGEMSRNKLHENVEPMDINLRKQALCSHLHVTPAQGHTSTVLADEKDKSDAHTSLVKADVLVQNPSSSFSDLKFCAKGNTNPFSSFSDLAIKGDSNKNILLTYPQTPLSYVEAAKQSMNTVLRQEPQNEISSSLLKGIHVSDMDKDGGSRVIVPTETLMRRMELCKLSIIGRVILAKGEETWPTKKLRERLNEVWSFKSSWRLISLGKGFFHILLTSQEEYEKVWLKGAIHLKPGVMRLQKWVFGFDPLKEKSTNAQVWFRFYNIPWCLWDVSILTALSRKIGTPIRFDNNTINGDFGHYARVLIDVDLSKNIKAGLQLDCGKDLFDVKVVPESIPQFCKACFNIGHSSTECRLIRKNLDNAKATDELKNTKADSVLQDRLKAQKGRKFDSFSVKGIQEVVPDGEPTKRNQKDKGTELTQSSKDFHTYNKFSALQEHEDTEMGNENKAIQNSGTEMTSKDNAPIHNRNSDEAKGEETMHETSLCKPCIPSKSEKSIKEIRKWVESTKWSDMVENDEKQENAPRASVNSSPIRSSKSKQSDLVSSVLDGKLMQFDRATGNIYFSPLPSKTSNNSSFH